MLERFKSAVLLFLVLSSLLLTYQLWYGQKPAELTVEDIYEKIVVEQPRPLEQIIRPSEIALAAENGYYVFREGNTPYDRLWEPILTMLHSMVRQDFDYGNTELQGARPELVCFFEPLLPVGNDLFFLPDFPGGSLSALELIEHGDIYLLKLTDPERETIMWAELDEEQSALLGSLIRLYQEEDHIVHRKLDEEGFSVYNGQEVVVYPGIFVPLESFYLAREPVYLETLDRELILKTFFADYSMARTIEEKNGGVIYTDGEKGLRLTGKGLEYSYPRMEDGQASQTRAEALYNSGALISFHGGWPPGLRLVYINLPGEGQSAVYDVQWRMYHQGYPLYAGKPTRMFFNDRGLIHYSRFIFNVRSDSLPENDLRPVAQWQDALQKALDHYVQQGEGQQETLNIEAFNPGYAVVANTGNELWAEPVWHLQVNGSRILLEADNLNPILAEDLQ